MFRLSISVQMVIGTSLKYPGVREVGLAVYMMTIEGFLRFRLRSG